MKKSRLLVSVLFFGVLIVSLAPVNGWLDTSEMSAASHLLGIGHPPGQPLYSMIGKLFQFLPFGNLAFRSNVLSAVLLALSLFLFSGLCKIILRECESKFYISLAILIGLYFFLAYSFMIQGTRAELYSLNLFLSILVLYCLVDEKYFAGGFFLIGLSLGCHPLLGILLLPGLLVVTIGNKKGASAYLKGFLFLAVGASVYLYLPLRASSYSVYNFGNPDNLSAFLWVVTGELYKAYGELSASQVFTNAVNIIYIFMKQLHPVVFILSSAGILFFIRSNFRSGIMLGVIMLANVSSLLLNMHFDMQNPDLHGYLLLSFVVLAIGFLFFTVISAQGVRRYLRGRRLNGLAWSTLSLIILLAVIQVFRFFPSYARGKDYSAYVFGRDVVSGLTYGSGVFAGSFSTFSVLSYLNYAEKYRDDLGLLYAGFMENKGYKRTVAKNYPEFGSVMGDAGSGFRADILSRLKETGIPVFVELAIKKRGETYSIRYPESILEKLERHEWFFEYKESAGNDYGAHYRKFMKEKIINRYVGAEKEFKRQILLGLFLHSRLFIYRGDYETAEYIIGEGLLLNDLFGPFIFLKQEIEDLR